MQQEERAGGRLLLPLYLPCNACRPCACAVNVYVHTHKPYVYAGVHLYRTCFAGVLRVFRGCFAGVLRVTVSPCRVGVLHRDGGTAEAAQYTRIF